MCSRIYTDKKSEKPFGGRVSCHTLDFPSSKIPTTMDMLVQEAVLGDRITVNLNTGYMNARLESLERVWIPKKLKFVQTDEKIMSFMEGDKMFYLPSHVDILCLAAILDDSFEFKVVTRDDGVVYHQKNGVYPPFVTEDRAKKEHEVHHRWPIYRTRLPLEAA